MAVYLSTLAISDIGALLSFIPLLVRLTKGQACSYTTAFFYAHFELFVLTTFMSTSIFNVLAMTVDRYGKPLYENECVLVLSLKSSFLKLNVVRRVVCAW